MGRIGLCALALLACGLASCAEAPALKLPAVVRGAPGEWIQIQASGDGAAVAWLSLDDGLKVLPSALLCDQRTAHAVACRPGQYRVRAISCRGDVLSKWAHTLVVVGGGVAAEAPEARRPAERWAVVVEETAQRTPAQAAVLRDAGVLRRVREGGWRVRVADRDAADASGRAPADLAPYLRLARGKQLPYLILTDAAGTLLYQGAAPEDAAGVIDLLQRAEGVK